MRALQEEPGRTRHRRPLPRLLVGVVLATVTLVTTWTVAARPDVTTAEALVFRAVNTAPDVLWPVLWPPMQLGTVGAPVVLAAAVMAALRRWRPAVVVLIAGSAAWAATQAVKALDVRSRPDALLPDVLLREGAHGLGFVSGHVAIATALATVVWPHLSSRGRVAAIALVIAVGLGRVYAGVHLPLDVVGGVAIGVLVGTATNALVGVPLQPGDARKAPRGAIIEPTRQRRRST